MALDVEQETVLAVVGCLAILWLTIEFMDWMR